MVHVIIHLSKAMECITPRVNPEVYCGLKVIMIHQCKFIVVTNVPLLGQGGGEVDIDNRAGLAYVRHREYGKAQ